MRDPKRIGDILQTLGQLWMNNPDLRLGQIVENAKAEIGRADTDTFYVEDGEIHEGLKRLAER